MLLKKEFTFVLSDKFEYQHNGQSCLAEKLLLRAPSNSETHEDLMDELAQAIMRAQFSHIETFTKISRAAGKEETTNKEEKKDIKEEAKQMIAMLLASKEQFKEIKKIFKNLLFSGGVCLVDGKEPFVSLFYAKISRIDINQLMGEFIVNFL